jgi:hypothetical protein
VSHDALQALSYYGIAFDLGHWKAAYALGQLYAGDERESQRRAKGTGSSRKRLDDTTMRAAGKNTDCRPVLGSFLLCLVVLDTKLRV